MSEPSRDAQAARLARLLAQSALKNQSAFSELYSLTAPKLFGVALRILRRQDWAEEVLASMTRLWRRPVRLETRRGTKPVRLGHDGTKSSEESLVEPAA